jgi:nucleotide-binding universal stress UspA family protein
MLLIGIDFSRASAGAALEARALAGRLGVRVRFAHIRPAALTLATRWP